MSTEFTFVVEKSCPICGKSTRVVKVKSRLVATQVDNDYCCHYRDFDPMPNRQSVLLPPSSPSSER